LKVWEKIAQSEDTKNWSKESIISKYSEHDNCPAGIEYKSNYIGESRLKRHCNVGCGVYCLEEYLDLNIKTNNGVNKIEL